MTIGLGLLVSDAIIIGADTQVGIDDSTALKNRQGKISWATRSEFGQGRIAALATTGAGTLSHIKHLQQDLSEMITGGGSSPLMNDFERNATQHINEFYGKYVLPFHGHSNAPYFNLLFAYVSPDGGARLWSTSENLTTPSQSIATVGVGAMYANILLHRLFFPMWPMNYRVAILIAAYVLHEVKENIDGCGKESDIVCLGMGFQRSVFLLREHIKEFEVLFDELTSVQTEGMKVIFMGGEHLAPTNRKLDSVRRKIDKVVEQVERLII